MSNPHNPQSPTAPTGLGFIHKHPDHIRVNSNGRLVLCGEHEMPPPPNMQQIASGLISQFPPPHHATSSTSSLVSTSSMEHLSEEYREALRTARHHPNADPTYIQSLQVLFDGLNEQGPIPQRPTTTQMEPFFRRHRYPARSSGRGSRGGSINHECLWPGCDFKHTLQKCIDHFFCQHVAIKFFLCGIEDCNKTFLRKHDLDKHRARAHNIPKPRDHSE